MNKKSKKIHYSFSDWLIFIGGILVAFLFIGACIFAMVQDAMPIKNDYNTDVRNAKLPYIESADYCYYYSLLSDNQKQIYDTAVYALWNNDDSFKFTLKDDINDEAEYRRVITAVEYDHPELFWYNGAYACNSTGFTANIRLGVWNFWDYSLSRDEQINELEEAANYVVELARQNASDEYHLVKFVHDYIIETTEYAYEERDEYTKPQHSASCEYIYTAYGCLVNHRAVCAGYAKAFQLVLNKLGIPCTYITGHVYSDLLSDNQKNNLNHGWNRLQLDGENYYTDVTWDDRVTFISYSYFNITTEELEETRSIGTMFVQPQCTSTYYNYYEYGE